MVKVDGSIMSIREITQIYGTAKINFLEFHRIKTLAQKYVSKLLPNTNIQLENPKPNIPFQYSILLQIKGDASDIYKVLSTKHKLNYYNKVREIKFTPQVEFIQISSLIIQNGSPHRPYNLFIA